MDPGDLLRLVAEVLERLGVPYLITGSTATITYGEPRFTNDIDIAIRLDAEGGRLLAQQFGADFYLDHESLSHAVQQRSSFNLIHPASGLKVDFMVTDDSPFNTRRFERVRPLVVDDGGPIRFASPEDVIVKKLEYFKEGSSEKHLRDIAGVLRVSEVDMGYIERWAKRLDLEDPWKKAKEAAAAR